jgi:hypothetical protein
VQDGNKEALFYFSEYKNYQAIKNESFGKEFQIRELSLGGE